MSEIKLTIVYDYSSPFKFDFWISSCWENLYSDLCVMNISEFTMILMIKKMPNVLMQVGFS